MALSRFECWLRSAWHATTIPVGRCVRRIALSVLFTCCPPAPPERYVSTRRSFSSISTSMSSLISATTSREANDVCRRLAESKGLMRTSRCTPRSAFRKP